MHEVINLADDSSIHAMVNCCGSPKWMALMLGTQGYLNVIARDSRYVALVEVIVQPLKRPFLSHFKAV